MGFCKKKYDFLVYGFTAFLVKILYSFIEIFHKFDIFNSCLFLYFSRSCHLLCLAFFLIAFWEIPVACAVMKKKVFYSIFLPLEHNSAAAFFFWHSKIRKQFRFKNVYFNQARLKVGKSLNKDYINQYYENSHA